MTKKKIALIVAVVFAVLLTLTCCKTSDPEQTRGTEVPGLQEEMMIPDTTESSTLPFIEPGDGMQAEDPVVFIPPTENGEGEQTASEPAEAGGETEKSTEPTQPPEDPNETVSPTAAEELEEESDSAGQYGDFF